MTSKTSTSKLCESGLAGQHRKASTRLQERKELSLFFAFTVKEKSIEADPTANLAKPVVRQEQTGYVPHGSFTKLLTAITDPKHYALVLLLRWSGLRITDALKLERKNIVGDLLMIYTTKTSTPVTIPLPPKVLRALNKLSTVERYFEGDTRNKPMPFAVRSNEQLSALASNTCIRISWRDSFAIELLVSGTPVDQVSKLLGHASIRTTELHYLPFVKARQDQLIASVSQVVARPWWRRRRLGCTRH